MNTTRIRSILNILFMVGAFASVIMYFTMEDRKLFLYVCGASIFLKLMEFVLRFLRL